MSDEIEAAVAAGAEIARRMPTWDELYRNMGHWAYHQQQEWAGMPLPVQGFKLTVEDRSPWAAKMDMLQHIIDGGTLADDGTTIVKLEEEARVCTDDDANWFPVNSWYSNRLRQTVTIARNSKTGKVIGLRTSAADFAIKTNLIIDTMRVSQIWHMDTEIKALETLRGLVKEHIWESYFMTGTFLESSKKSGLCYIFRRCRPTLAVSFRNAHAQGTVIAALCLHPIGYYQRTHAGSMCPTDDVMAHLLMMRGDEHLFWKRANQHDALAPEAGL